MITIKNDRGWENPKCWEDVESLAGYVKDIDPNQVKLKAVIGKYREPELRVCGLSSCHTKHFRGYLVSTTDGRVTNIGVDCGKKHFGVDFDTMSRQLDRDWQNQMHRETIASAQNRIENWEQECSLLLNGEYGGTWLSKQFRALMNRDKGLPQSITKTITDLIKTGNNVLFKERIATKQEKEIFKETGQKISEVVREEVGSLKGLSGLGKIEELRNLLPKDLEPNLKVLANIDVNNVDEKELRYWSKWSGDVESKLLSATSIIDDARQFFSKENISLLAEISETRDEEKIVMTFSKRYK